MGFGTIGQNRPIIQPTKKQSSDLPPDRAHVLEVFNRLKADALNNGGKIISNRIDPGLFGQGYTDRVDVLCADGKHIRYSFGHKSKNGKDFAICSVINAEGKVESMDNTGSDYGDCFIIHQEKGKDSRKLDICPT